jgi:nucleoside-diphosphate-sugar epimerase
VRRAVYASSVQTYGMLGSPSVPPRYLPVDEAHPLLATNPYAVSKAVGESIAESFVRRGIVRQVISLRYTAIVPAWPAASEGAVRESATGSLFTRVSVAEAARATRLACEVERAGHTPVNVVSGRPAVAWREEDLVAAYGEMPVVRGALRGTEALISGRRAREVLGFEGE